MDFKLFKKIPFLIALAVLFGPMLGGRSIFIIVLVLALFYIIKILIKKLSLKSMPNAIDLDSIKSMQNAKRLVYGGIAVLLLLWLFFSSIVIIDAGKVGVYSLFGKVSNAQVDSGFHLINPLAKVNELSTRTEEYTMSKVHTEGKVQGDDAIPALTKEGLNLTLDITVLYHLEADKAPGLYKDVGLNYEEKVIRPEIRSIIREIIAQYEAKDIYSERRDEVVQKIKNKLGEKLGARGITVEDILLRDVTLPDNLAKAIQEKLQAEQEAQKYDFLLQTEKKEAERKRIGAAGQRDSQKIINESLTTNYLYYQYISQLKDRQGTIYVPTNPSTGMPQFKELGQ